MSAEPEAAAPTELAAPLEDPATTSDQQPSTEQDSAVQETERAGEDTQTQTPAPAPTLKRKQSSSPDPDDTNKKRRLSPEPSPQNPETNGASKSRVPEPSAPPPTRRASKPIDERKRGQRLFGAVLGALGGGTGTQLAKRREIERKQREKLRQQAEEEDVEREERVARLRQIRQKEQRRFEAAGMRIRHENVIAMAHALQTRAEPRLYYRPWELRAEEEEIIKKQVKEAEEVVERERREAEEQNGGDKEEVEGGAEELSKDPANLAEHRSPGGDVDMQEAEAKDDQGSQIDGADEKGTTDERQTKAGADVEMGDSRKDDIDEGAEDVHGEDTVIY